MDSALFTHLYGQTDSVIGVGDPIKTTGSTATMRRWIVSQAQRNSWAVSHWALATLTPNGGLSLGGSRRFFCKVTDSDAPGEVGGGVQNGQMTVQPDISIGVIGGSGLYSLFEPDASELLTVATPYGEAVVTVGRFAERHVAFLTRHGSAHSLAPHLINYRANIWALAWLGVKAIVSSSAVGGVDPDYPPGTLVVTDQFIDRTQARADTFYDEGSVQHLPAADPFCPTLNATARTILRELGEQFRPTGTAVVIQGPRFSTRAESVWFRSAGAHTVNMTLYPEVVLASELNIGTVNLSFVTDSDSGLAPVDGAVGDAVSGELVFERLAAARPRIVAALGAIIAAIPDDYPGRQLIDPAAVAAVLERPRQ